MYVGLDFIIIIQKSLAGMLNNLSKFSQNEQNPKGKTSQSPDKQCLFTKTSKMTKISKPTFQNLKVSESTIVLAENPQSIPCPKCKKYEKKCEKLRLIQREVSQIKERNQEIKEEVQLLLHNFMYILELASENIVNGAKLKVKKIIASKQNLIQKQCQKIKRLQNQSEVLIDKVDAGLENSQKIAQLQEKIKLLQAENKQLREAANDKCNFQDPNCIRISSTEAGTLEGRQKSAKQPLSNTFRFGSVNPEKGFQQNQRIKKRKTLDTDCDSPPQQNNHIKSIKSLKMKINFIKQKLINQKL